MPPRDYQPGELVPGTVYRIVRPIGAGGMGTVYDVEDTTIGKRYVLKTLHPRLGSREDLARRMQNEARTLARLHHPNIVEVITAGVTADNLRLPFFVMERLDGQSLRVVLEKRGRLELPHAYNLVIDLLDALDHAHDRGIVHRDVKPDNIFLHRSPSGSTVTKLLDFGIVSLLDDADDTSGRFLGTLRYAAPEQLRGEKPTPKTDVYSAALVFYEILAGRGPFDDEGDPHRVGQAHLHQRPPPLLHFAWVPTELNGLVMAALDKDPSVRPRDAFSFAASLRNIKRVYPSMPRTLYATSGGLTTETTITAVVDPSGTAAEESSELARATDLGPADDAQLTHSMHSMGSTATRVPHGGTDVLTSSSSLGLFTRPPPPSLFTGSSSRGGFPSEEVTGDEKEPLSFAPAGPDDLAAVRRRPTLSEEPQVRSVPVASAPSRSRSAVALAGLGIAGLGALGILFVRVPHRSFGSS
ncbi:MAG TPA: serine/threonine-protein kinase, partial [Polyangiaceae bacterium]|nr:serine/threonine-protein kinase [Polyangiaceae bacterium]